MTAYRGYHFPPILMAHVAIMFENKSEYNRDTGFKRIFD